MADFEPVLLYEGENGYGHLVRIVGDAATQTLGLYMRAEGGSSCITLNRDIVEGLYLELGLLLDEMVL